MNERSNMPKYENKYIALFKDSKIKHLSKSQKGGNENFAAD
jgi:hypothetical protein